MIQHVDEEDLSNNSGINGQVYISFNFFLIFKNNTYSVLIKNTKLVQKF